MINKSDLIQEPKNMLLQFVLLAFSSTFFKQSVINLEFTCGYGKV